MQVHIGAIGHGDHTRHQSTERFAELFRRSLERKDNVQQAHTALLGHLSQKIADNFYKRALYICLF